jgi:hypothetical protein
VEAFVPSSVRVLELRFRGPYPCDYSATKSLALDEIIVRDTGGVNLARVRADSNVPAEFPCTSWLSMNFPDLPQAAGATVSALNSFSASYVASKAVDGLNSNCSAAVLPAAMEGRCSRRPADQLLHVSADRLCLLP